MSCDTDSCLVQRESIKQGETLSLAGTASLPTGTWSGAASYIDVAGVSHALTVVMSAPVLPATLWGVLISTTSANTATWPVGVGTCDVKFTDATSVVRKSPTFEIEILQAVTP
jgi:hypothetical protein